MITILIVVLLILLFAGPAYSYRSGWGYGPSGLIFVIFIILLIYLLRGRI